MYVVINKSSIIENSLIHARLFCLKSNKVKYKNNIKHIKITMKKGERLESINAESRPVIPMKNIDIIIK
jgi:hypothetical protein